MKKKLTKEEMLERAGDYILFNGYHHTSVRDIMHTAGMGKGSFSTYFDSKEEMGFEVLNATMKRLLEWQTICLNNVDASPLERIKTYFYRLAEFFRNETKCRGGCMVGNFSMELSSQSERFRNCIDLFFREVTQVFAGCIEEGQAKGEIKKNMAPLDMAELIMITWEGSVLRMKTMSNDYALDLFLNEFLSSLKISNNNN